MGEREIRAKYGGKLAKAINRAIRAECAGGNEALDKLTALAGAARHSGWKARTGKDTAEAAAYFKHQKDVVGRMDAKVRKRWGVPPDQENAGDAKPRRAGPSKGAAGGRPARAPAKPRARPAGNSRAARGRPPMGQ